jgi:hypothetical protein
VKIWAENYSLGKPSEEQLQKFSPCPTGTHTSYANYAAKQRKYSDQVWGGQHTKQGQDSRENT